MADKITVIACEADAPHIGGYKVLLSSGNEGHSDIPLEPGAEWRSAADLKLDEQYEADAIGRLNDEVLKLRDDNAMLQRGLEEANATIATLTRDLNEAQDNVDRLMEVRHTAPVPQGLIGVTTDRVENLPTIDQLPQHATMLQPAAPGGPESQDQRDVREHLARKAAVLAATTDEGTKPQE